VTLSVNHGEIVGLVGESGCGKSSLGKCIVRSENPTGGQILYRDSAGHIVDLVTADRGRLRHLQREVRVIFQDPFSSLNPRMTLLQIVGDPLKVNGIATGSELEDRVAVMLRKVGLSADHMYRYPHAFSGGERQRVNIARALILGPRIVVADEPVSALDVSVRAQILGLLQDLRDELGLTYIFISHDLSIVERLCTRTAVMYLGKIVEMADTAALYRAPQHPYTEALMSAVPLPYPRLRNSRRRIRLADDFPNPLSLPKGCFFASRCHYKQAICSEVSPQPNQQRNDSACHFAGSLGLSGALTTDDVARLGAHASEGVDQGTLG
jgi:peptide/nickel transport system ATP-binding protein